MISWFLENRAGFAGDLTQDAPLAKCTYYRIGGCADWLATPRSLDDLRWLREGIRATGIPYFVMGLGSNLLVADAGYRGLVIRISRLDLSTDLLAPNRIRAGSSVAVSTLLRVAAKEGWGGLEFLAGVPGSIGGVVCMNAGTHLGEACDRLAAVRTYSLSDGTVSEYGPADFKFEYRRNLFLRAHELILNADWTITPDAPLAVKARIDETLARRKATQPVNYPSCGSVFKNPPGERSWAVIDRLGLRGHRIGDAQISEKHSNFIVNLGAARATDVRALIELAQSRAQTELGIRLEEEVMYVGDFDEKS